MRSRCGWFWGSDRNNSVIPAATQPSPRPQKNGASGDGWVAAGMTELLRSLPQNHPQRDRILTAYRKMMTSLLRYQRPDGMWRQLIDHREAWPESSSTAMFT